MKVLVLFTCLIGSAFAQTSRLLCYSRDRIIFSEKVSKFSKELSPGLVTVHGTQLDGRSFALVCTAIVARDIKEDDDGRR